MVLLKGRIKNMGSCAMDGYGVVDDSVKSRVIIIISRPSEINVDSTNIDTDPLSAGGRTPVTLSESC